MTLMLIRRTLIFREIASYYFQPKKHSLSSRILRAVHSGTEAARYPLLNPKIGDRSNDYKIDIVDDETWQVSTGFAEIWKDATIASRVANRLPSRDQVVDPEPRNSNDPDFDEIDDLRICGNLFFKLDRDSKEYEEYNFDFHRKKSCKNKTKETRKENVLKREDERSPRSHDPKTYEMNKLEKSLIGKRQRVPTFNQLTGPYHEPFCLDVYISKASVRVCIVHRATSKVVAVAHSISKDMKFDLGSTKNAAACAAVGKVLAQRALADDIHNVVYTPRNGEKLEGKLQNVVESVINNGVRVKIKLKKKKVPKHGFQPINYKPSSVMHMIGALRTFSQDKLQHTGERVQWHEQLSYFLAYLYTLAISLEFCQAQLDNFCCFISIAICFPKMGFESLRQSSLQTPNSTFLKKQHYYHRGYYNRHDPFGFLFSLIFHISYSYHWFTYIFVFNFINLNYISFTCVCYLLVVGVSLPVGDHESSELKASSSHLYASIHEPWCGLSYNQICNTYCGYG
ncbi:hypothetical protein L1987_81592 [Smallanthus sonchifolius]|uniref:Uncharacterized protein n=1 Tax=Smallanthus sonchifolius TaxID=185202 RepID=A0ACB8YRB1_9ASTR|nr:hypothetical protein L1987_81592 [Smallanthus sonchifolius]